MSFPSPGKLKLQKLFGRDFSDLSMRVQTMLAYNGGIVLKGVVKSIFLFLVKEYEK